jgi:hypothetical protein
MSLQTVGNAALVLFSVAAFSLFILNESVRRTTPGTPRDMAIRTWRKRAGLAMVVALLVLGLDAYLIHRSQAT